MAKWGKGRFLKFKDRAYDLLKEYPEGLTAEGILDRVSGGWNSKPASVSAATELLKRDSRFAGAYGDVGTVSMIGNHYKVMIWVISDEEQTID